jgi:hypothetical protein
MLSGGNRNGCVVKSWTRENILVVSRLTLRGFGAGERGVPSREDYATASPHLETPREKMLVAPKVISERRHGLRRFVAMREKI